MKKIYCLVLLLFFISCKNSDEDTSRFKEIAESMKIELLALTPESARFICDYKKPDGYVRISCFIVKNNEEPEEISLNYDIDKNMSFSYRKQFDLDTEYTVYLLVNNEYKSAPFVFKTPKIFVNEAKLLDDVDSEFSNATSGLRCALEGVTFEVSGRAFFSGMKAEIVSIDDDNIKYPLDVVVESPTKLYLTFPENILQDEAADYEYSKDFYLFIEGVRLRSRDAVRNDYTYPCILRLYNKTPAIISVDQSHPSKNIIFMGYFFNYKYTTKEFFGVKLIPDRYYLVVKRNDGEYILEYSDFWFYRFRDRDVDDLIHTFDGLGVNKEIFEPGETTVSFMISIGGTIVMTNEITFVKEP